ncbi:peptide/nickel transport system substrate-binding protein [Enhydrobacter aerosaccus]|uniref:Peptide/nickel transport system substrate-binding protein n=1 Tax=Enhydrobacter aerosaccus TaxID=225324 RepID=A0A1T4LIF3_9HYPH|nr:ABC transporter substrate-binding protein [Enhydrobacter aerosaccus]SJZ54549.1 peptide/nickel transport system substrate-binding protein [Enhydrobacter aerosaccus]
MSKRFMWATLAAMATAVTAATPAFAQRTVTILREIDTDRYDPHKSTSRSGAEVIYMMGDTLVNLDFDMKTLKPGLAKSWSVSPDGLTYTFKLRDDVSFCSGKKLTAKDVVATYERWLDPETKGLVKWRMGDVDKVSAPDDYTVEYKLKKPFSELLYQMTQYFHTIINVEQAKQLGADFGVKGFDGTGPYCFESWTPRDSTVLTKHAGYKWGPPIYPYTEAQVDKVVWKIMPEENTRVTALQTDPSDASQYVPYWALKDLMADKKLSVTKAENYFWTYFIGFKVDHALVSDIRVREALNLAVDQKAITDAVTFGFAEPADTMLEPGVLDYNGKLDKTLYGENVKKAEALLDEAGWKKGPDGFRYKDGKKLAPVLYGISGAFKEIAEAVQGDLRKVGVDLQIQLFDATVAWGKLATQEFDAFGMSFPYVSAGDALNLYFRSANVPTPNRMNWKDKETDDLLDKGMTATDDATRAAAYEAVQKKVHDAFVWIPLFHEPLFIVAGSNLKPIKAHGNYGCGFYKGLGIAFK